MSQTLSPSLARCYGLARGAGVEDLARQRLSLSQGDAAEPERPSPWSGWRMFGPGTGRPHPPAHSPPPAFTARATASYGRDCASRAFAQVPGGCDG